MRTVRLMILTCLALGVGALLPALASASYPWTNQNAMLFEGDASLRETFIVDTAPGELVSRQLFLSQPYSNFYAAEGFDRNFFTWAPRTVVGDEYTTGRGWTRCASAQVPVPGGRSHCASDAITFGAPGSIREDVLEGLLSGYKWGEGFVSDVCGCWSPANTAPKESPVPVIEGVKFEDQNTDGIRELGEPGIPGWKIYLFYNNKEVASTTTGAGGAYAFRLDADAMPIGAGTYSLKEESREGWHQQRAPRPIFVSVGAGDTHFEGNDFGNWRLATISGHKFDDSNVNGVWDEGESPLGEWGIQLSNGETRTTAADGSYSFSVLPGTYTVGETLQSGWRQTTPGGLGTREFTVVSGQVVEGADFGNVCLGGVAVEPFDSSTGEPFAGLEVTLEEVSVPGVLEDEPALPRTATGTAQFGELLPGTYRVLAYLPEGVFTTDPVVLVGGRFAIVEEVTVSECKTTALPLHLFTKSTAGRASGGVSLSVPAGIASGEFEFTVRNSAARGSLQYQDPSLGLSLNTAAIEAVYVSAGVAWVWGKVQYAGAMQRFRLRAVDAGEPGTFDRFELTVAPGYEAGQGGPIKSGNVQVRA
jgi:SdrD B-like protein